MIYTRVKQKEIKVTENVNLNKGMLLLMPRNTAEIVEGVETENPMLVSKEYLIFANMLIGVNDNLLIGIPLQFYSIPTTVSYSSIEYEHKDIDKFAEDALRVLKKDMLENAKYFLSSWADKLLLIPAGLDMHKHPTPSSFSGHTGDRCKYVDDLGICYRVQNATNTPIISLVFSINNDDFIISDVETKIVNVKPHKTHFCEGTYEYIPSIVAYPKHLQQETPFGELISDSVFDRYSFTTDMIDTYKYDTVQDILFEWEEIQFEAESYVDVYHYKVKALQVTKQQSGYSSFSFKDYYGFSCT